MAISTAGPVGESMRENLALGFPASSSFTAKGEQMQTAAAPATGTAAMVFGNVECLVRLT